MSYDVVTVGEAMLRLWVPPGERMERTDLLRVSVAGAEANVAVALGRMGRSVAWLSALPDSPLGRRTAFEISSHGVDVSHVRWMPDSRMGTYYVELSVPPRTVEVIYDRAHSAASRMTIDDLPKGVVESAAVAHISGITPALSESCRLLASEVSRRARALSVDVNHRARLWTHEQAKPVLTELCTGATMVILTREDARDVFGIEGEVNDILAGVRDLCGAPHVVLTLGAEGAAWLSEGVEGAVPAYSAEVIDRIGAGDAFAAGVLMGFLDGDLEQGVRRGLAMAALKMGIFGDQLVADPSDVERVMSGASRGVAR